MEKTANTKLTEKDFFVHILKEKGSPFMFYINYVGLDGLEICIEPCLNGYDVALYINEELKYPKICTDLVDKNGKYYSKTEGARGSISAIEEAIKYANQLLERFNND